MSGKKQINDKDLELISSSLDQQLSEFERVRLNKILMGKTESKIDNMDGEMSREAVKKLQRYSLLSAIINHECGDSVNSKFSQQVIQSIESQSDSGDLANINNEVSSSDFNLPRDGYNTAKRTYGMKQIAGLAIAVSVATLSFLTIQQYTQTSLESEQFISSADVASLKEHSDNMTNKVNKISPRVQFAPVQLNTQSNLSDTYDVQESTSDHEIEAYIYNHSGYASGRIVSPYSEITQLQDHSD